MLIQGGKVFDLEQGFLFRELCTDGAHISPVSGDDRVFHVHGGYVIPGLVDVHFHGAVGEDFSDATAEGLQKIADFELSQGVTHICPASVTLPEAELTALCATAAAHRAGGRGGAEVVGVHLEGPFLSYAKRGAQNADFLQQPDREMLGRLQKASGDCVKLLTVAPELPGALRLIWAATAAGIHVSLGHTTANYDQAQAGFAAGADHVTHLFNGMEPLHHRDPGVIGAAFDDPKVMVELICDGIHIHPSVVRSTFQTFGAERVILVSDSLRATGMPDGVYPFGGQKIEVRGNRATIAGHPETLAGSITSLMGCVRKAVEFGIPLADAVRAASHNPAQSIGIADQAGSLEEGRPASFVVLDQQLELKAVVLRGELVVGAL